MADSTLYTNALAIYDFENNANDTKGVKTLTAVGSPTYSTAGEAQGTYWAGELADDGSQYFSRLDDSFNFTGTYSVSFYVNFTSTADYRMIAVGFYNNGSGCGWLIQNDGSAHLRLTHRTDWTDTHYDFTGAALSTATRYHVVIIYNTTTNYATAYVSTTSFGNIINGTQVAATVDPGNGTGGYFYVGFRRWDGSGLNGYIDEVVLWNSAISSSDAAAIFAAHDGGTSWRETGAVIEQEGFRFLNDDGDETTATGKANQDVNINLAADTAFRLRFLLKATGNPDSINAQAEARVKPSGGAFGAWEKIN